MSLHAQMQTARLEGSAGNVETIVTRLIAHIRERIQQLQATASDYQICVVVNANELETSDLDFGTWRSDRQVLEEAFTRFRARYPRWEGMEVQLHTSRKHPQVVIDWSESKEGEGATLRAHFDKYRSSVSVEEQRRIVDQGVAALWEEYDRCKTASADYTGQFRVAAREGEEKCHLTAAYYIHRWGLDTLLDRITQEDSSSATARWFPTEILRAFLATVPEHAIEERIYLEEGLLWVDWSAPPEEEFVVVNPSAGSVA